jgi:hypothetical protein
VIDRRAFLAAAAAAAAVFPIPAVAEPVWRVWRMCPVVNDRAVTTSETWMLRHVDGTSVGPFGSERLARLFIVEGDADRCHRLLKECDQ